MSENSLVDAGLPNDPNVAQQQGSGSAANVSSGGFKRERGIDDDEDDEDGGKQGRERRKIEIKFIQDKSRRHITFSKRKAGIMKKAYELSVLTGTQVLLLVVSETGLVYTFTTPKLQPLVTKPEGKNLIQACLNAPEDPQQNGQQQQQQAAQQAAAQQVAAQQVQQQQQQPQQLPPHQQQQLNDPASLGGLAPHAQGGLDDHSHLAGRGGVPGQAGGLAAAGGMYMSPEQAAAYNQYLGLPHQQQTQRGYLPQHPHLQSRPQ
ncbi:transcription factor MCM1 [Sugiyamaella lignohabitans]|uniref:Transcription factor MCM1 n=1 Tax=Sugiyamaella lignohabitans TaxID=796027 RepID=A0A167E400_9ASCO|nr:transcription factor MCM1 [Sugiyamaella lignohabitans]ANB13614.1 transcription factor MCM1 [Sugiyamaella lignohabitans]